MQLAGIQHVTVSPNLLRQLAARDASSWTETVGAYFSQGPKRRSWETLDYNALFGDDGAWRLAFTRHQFGASEGKLVQAINYFCDFQDKLEELVIRYA
jgi:transaldolase